MNGRTLPNSGEQLNQGRRPVAMGLRNCKSACDNRGMKKSEAQKRITKEQFTRQAIPFANAAIVKSDDLLGKIVRMAEVTAEDTTLDVACGPGLLVCGFAPLVCQAHGIDLTPAMLQEAVRLQGERRLRNVSWTEGDVTSLPYEDGSFSVVTCRFAFHHFSEPLLVLREMLRVCKPGGRIVVADSEPAADKAAAFNRMERLRDPSHVRALTTEELRSLFTEAGVSVCEVEAFRFIGELESLLARSFPLKGNADRVRRLFVKALIHDDLDVQPVKEGDKILYSFPVAILKAQKAQSLVR